LFYIKTNFVIRISWPLPHNRS